MIDKHDPFNDIEGTSRAMIRAARRAADLARQHGQPLVFWEDDRIVEIMPDDLPPLPELAPRAEDSAQ